MVDEADRVLAKFSADLSPTPGLNAMSVDQLRARDTETIQEIQGFLQRLAAKVSEQTGSPWRFRFDPVSQDPKASAETSDFRGILFHGELPCSFTEFKIYAGWFAITDTSNRYVDNVSRKNGELHEKLANYTAAMVSKQKRP